MATVPNHNMKFRVVTMTPVWAAELLKDNHPNNRKPKSHRITSWAREMSAGLWRLTHQPIAVDEDGFLIDGQNRLEAVCLSGAEVPMVLVTGVPRLSMVAVDCGVGRSVVDAARISGKPLPVTQYASVAKSMMNGLSNRRVAIGHQEVLKFIRVHHEALEFAFDNFARNAPTNPIAVRAVIARAFYRRNCRNRVREFCEALKSGLIDNKDKDVAVIKLRNWLLDTEGRHTGRRGVEIYAKTEYALHKFIEGELVSKIVETQEELFPLPTEPELRTFEEDAEAVAEIVRNNGVSAAN